jgi:hypothetical protein
MGLKERLEEVVADSTDGDEAKRASELLIQLIRLERQATLVLASAERKPDGVRREAHRLTLHACAEVILRESGRPMHVRELGAAIKATGWTHPRSRHARPDQILYQLAARLPRYPQFARVAPNTFALTEWGTSGPSAERPRPRLGVAKSKGDRPAREIDEELSGYGDEERAAWRSS